MIDNGDKLAEFLKFMTFSIPTVRLILVAVNIQL